MMYNDIINSFAKFTIILKFKFFNVST